MKAQKIIIKGTKLKQYLRDIEGRRRDNIIMAFLLYFYTILSLPTGIVYFFVTAQHNPVIFLYFLIGIPLGFTVLFNFFMRS
jgi:hypothetical protein